MSLDKKNYSLPKIENNIFFSNKNNKYKGLYKKLNDKFDFKILDKIKNNLKNQLSLSLKKNKKQYLSLIKKKKEYFNTKKKINISKKIIKNIKKDSILNNDSKINYRKIKKGFTQYFINNEKNYDKELELDVKLEKIKTFEMRPDTRIFPNMIFEDDCVFLFGGLNNCLLNDYWKYNILNKKWIKNKNCYKYLYKNGLIKYNGKYILFWGYQSYINTHILSSQFWEVYKKNNELKFQEIMIRNSPSKRIDYGYDNINNFLFILGGKDENNSIFNDLNIINWKIKKNLNLKIDNFKDGIYGHSLSLITNITNSNSIKNFKDYFNNFNKRKYYGIYIFGGKSLKEEFYSGLHIIDFVDNKLNIYKPKTFGIEPLPRIFHKSYYLKDISLYIIVGGLNFNFIKKINHIYLLNLENFNWISISNENNKFFDLYSFGSTIKKENDNIYIFGGYLKNKFSKSNLLKLTFYNN